MTKEFISRMDSDELLETLLFAIELPREDVIETKAYDFDDHVMLAITANQELDDGIHMLTDDFEVDDYSVEPMDWAPTDGGAEIRKRWRTRMYQRFKNEYAMRYLMDH